MSFLDKARPITQTPPTPNNTGVNSKSVTPVVSDVASSTPSFLTKAKPVTPTVPTQPSQVEKPSLFSKFKSDILAPVAGTALGLTKSGRTIQNLASKGVDKVFGTKGFGAPGTIEDAAKTIGIDPTSKQFKTGAFVGEAGSYMMPGSQAGALTKGAGVGTKMLVSGVTDAATQAVNAGKVDKQTLYTGLTSAATTGVFDVVGKVLAKTGEAIQNSVIKPNQADMVDGFSMDTVHKYDLGGSLQTTHNKTENVMNAITKERNAKLASSKTQIDLDNVYKATIERMKGDKLKTFGANTGVSKALDDLKIEIDNIGTKVSIPEADVVKRATGQYGAWTYGRPDADTSKQAVYNVFYNELKKTIENLSPSGVKELNQQLSELIPVQNAVIRRIPVAERNMPISLTDIIALSASTVDPSALGVLGITRAQKSGAFGNALFKGGTAVSNKAVPAGVGLGFLLNQGNNQE